MRKSTSFEAAYEALGRIESGSITEESKAELKQALNSKSSLLVSRAADIVGRKGLNDLIPDMISAFDRFMIAPAKNDKQCSAKTSIANALNNIEYMGDEIFLAGAYHVQMEPVFGGQEDTAVELRSACAFGLARIEHPDVHYVLADLLVDKKPRVRTAAVKALAYLGTPESELMLRLKVLTGEGEAEVLSECFSGLITLAPDRSLDFVARYLHSSDTTVAECAALAIGGSKTPRAYDILRDCWDDDLSPTRRRSLLLPIALVRSTESLNFLLEVLSKADTTTACEAITVLGLYMDDESINRIYETVRTTGNAEILNRFYQEFRRSSV